MNFLATNGNELYTSQKKENNYNWNKLKTIYHKNYSDILTEIEVNPNKNIIYDIYILPNIDLNQYGFQCLFSLIDTSESSQSFYLENSNFILHWKDNKIFVTNDLNSESEHLAFRIRNISIGEQEWFGDKHNIFTGIDIKNKTLNTGIFNNNSVLSIHPSTGTKKINTVEKKNLVLQKNTKYIYNYIIPENDNKLYLFCLHFEDVEGKPDYRQFTYANGKLENGRVGPLQKNIGSRYLRRNSNFDIDLRLKPEFSIEYVPNNEDSNQSYLKINSLYEISSIDYSYLNI